MQNLELHGIDLGLAYQFIEQVRAPLEKLCVW